MLVKAGSLRWAVGALMAVIGAMMLIVPHQLRAHGGSAARILAVVYAPV